MQGIPILHLSLPSLVRLLRPPLESIPFPFHSRKGHRTGRHRLPIGVLIVRQRHSPERSKSRKDGPIDSEALNELELEKKNARLTSSEDLLLRN